MGGDYPPQLTEGMDYRKWKREVEIWEMGTNIREKGRRAAACILRVVDQKARDFAT